jgi:nucleotide-binding universal stress UspA family protein
VTERYVVGIDGSRPSAAALQWTIARTRQTPAPIVLVHVDEDEAGSMGHDYREFESRRGAHLVAEALTVATKALPDAQVSVALLSGGVAWALAAFAQAGDVLVIGTGKTGFLRGRVLGSRSVQIAIAVACTVAVIPDIDLRFRRGVVAGIDRVQTAGTVANAAAAEATARGEELLLVQSASPSEVAESGAGRAGLAVTFAMNHVRAGWPQLEIRSRVTARPPAEALLDTARDRALLVLGPGSLDPSRSPIGSVLHGVLLNANAPVLVARPVEGRQLVGPIALPDSERQQP